jgi:hypothetical protein
VKKLIALAIVAGFLLSTTVGCGGTGETKATGVKAGSTETKEKKKEEKP